MTTAIRPVAVAYAVPLAGLTANPTAADDSWPRYLALIAPGETDARAADMARESGCALVAAGIWRAVLGDIPYIAPPYKDRDANARLERAAARAGAIRGPLTVPQPGDVVQLGAPLWHVLTVVSVRDLGGGAYEVESIDGGGREPEGDPRGWECIRRHVRRLDGGRLDGIAVEAVYDLDAMAECYGEREQAVQ